MPKLNRNGVNLYFEVHGSGPALILTHGYSATLQMWKGQIEPLSKKHRLIIWDMRGHGQSDYPDDLSAYSEDHVGGLSLGGYMSLAFYRRHPERVRSLLIIDAGPGFKKDEARQKWNRNAFGRADTLERDGLASLKTGSAERAYAVHRDALGLAKAARGMLTQRNADVINSLPEVKVPSLVVVGSNDTPFLAGSDYMASKIPNARKVVIKDAGHASNIDQPEAFNEVVVGFIDKLPPV